MWKRVLSILTLSVTTLHCCKTRNDKENIKVKSKESKYFNPINDTYFNVLAGYEDNLTSVKNDWKEYDYDNEIQELDNLKMWEQNFNLSNGPQLNKIKNISHMKIVGDSHDESNHHQKLETLKSYMSKNCLKDFDIFLSMNHEDEWEKYHNEIMHLETQYRKWENSQNDDDWKDLKESEWVVPPM